ncbi:putative angiotensin-converting enzyme 2 [Dioscorea sansibarensis]
MNQAVSSPTMEDLKNTQAHIECCLQRYMNEKETIEELHREKGIDPLLTHLVWQQLEGRNQVFFKEYYFRLILMEQSMEFNKLTETVLEAKEAQKQSYVSQQTRVSLSPGNALCNGGTRSGLMGNGDGFNGIPSSRNVNVQECQGMNGMDEFSFSAGAPSLGFHAPDQYGFINHEAPPNYNGSNIMPQGSSVAPCSTSNNLGLMEQQQFNIPTTVDGFDQLLSNWPTVNNGVPGNEVRASCHGSGVQDIGNEAVGISPS